MDRHMMYAGVSVVLAGLLGFSWAKGGGALGADEAKTAAHDIAVVDINKVFASHKRLLEKSEDLKRDAERARDEAKTLYEAAMKLQEELKLQKPGSVAHARITKELQEKGVEMQKFQQDTQKKFAEKQTANFLASYQSINEEVLRIAEARGFRLVINFSSEPVDQKETAKAMQIMSRQILYQNGLDITEEVIQAVN